MNRILVIGGLMIALALVLTPACAPAGSPGPTPASEAQFDAQAEEQAMRDRIPALVDAWNKGDVEAWAARVAVDYKGVNQYGQAINGRAEFQKNFAEEVARRTGSPRIAATVDSITFPRPDLAVVCLSWDVTGVPPETPGTKGKWMGVSVKQGGEWHTVAAQTMVPSVSPSQP